MNTKTNKLIAGLFFDSINIQILRSIYDKEVTADTISNLISIDKNDVVRRLKTLYKQSLVVKREKENDEVYSLRDPKVCDPILMLTDSIEVRE